MEIEKQSTRRTNKEKCNQSEKSIGRSVINQKNQQAEVQSNRRINMKKCNQSKESIEKCAIKKRGRQ